MGEDQKLEQEIQKLKSMKNNQRPEKTEMDMSMSEGLFNPFEKFVPLNQEMGSASTTENIPAEGEEVMKTTYKEAETEVNLLRFTTTMTKDDESGEKETEENKESGENKEKETEENNDKETEEDKEDETEENDEKEGDSKKGKKKENKKKNDKEKKKDKKEEEGEEG